MKAYIKSARKYEGMHEKRDTPMLKALMGKNPRIYAWCAYFITGILRLSGVHVKANGLARSYLKVGTRVPLEMAREGDVVVLKRGLPWQGHVGFYLSHDKNSIKLLGGNQSDMVRESNYPRKNLLGVRRIRNAN